MDQAMFARKNKTFLNTEPEQTSLYREIGTSASEIHSFHV